MGIYDNHKLLIANRGEIAVRIIRTAKRLGLKTVAIYTPSGTLSPHVLQADEAFPLILQNSTSEALAYLDIPSIIAICRTNAITLVHPGYGFLSENADFASQVRENGMIWLGPRPEVIREMGVKHVARKIAVDAGIPILPGSSGLLTSLEEALEIGAACGFPVILKATAGGGGMGMFLCNNEGDLKEKFELARTRAQALFHNDGVYMEKYVHNARHIEIQIFGNGLGEVVHMRERECSIQRRHQKVIEESPSPFCLAHRGLLEKLCDASIALGQSIHYGSAGTIEFIVDNESADFYFLEMNTRIQVEHPITEECHPGLDLVELMIKQGLAEISHDKGLPKTSIEMNQTTYDDLYRAGQARERLHSIEGRIYAEDPYRGFTPAPGLLQHVLLDDHEPDWLRNDSWVETGTTVTTHFDSLLAKVIVTGASRKEAIERFMTALKRVKILGPTNNLRFLAAIAESIQFRTGSATTKFLDNFSITPCSFEILSPGVDTAIQDLPGRTLKLGIPTSGPMDDVAFSVANILVGNPHKTEGLEIIIIPGRTASFQFFVPTVLAVTGRDASVKINGTRCSTWTKLVVPEGGILDIEAGKNEEPNGFRVYLCIRGGFPDVPLYLGSKSTSMGLGGFQGRSLVKGDLLALGNCGPRAAEKFPQELPKGLRIHYPEHWVIYVLPGPHGDKEFMTEDSVDRFYSSTWKVSSSSNRLGIRLESDKTDNRIQWSRPSGGEGGSHPSNILDNGYAPGTINMNGDTPVILTKEGPDMGGYMCLCTVATTEIWKLGQVIPGKSTISFRRISWAQSLERMKERDRWLTTLVDLVERGMEPVYDFDLTTTVLSDVFHPTVLHATNPEQEHSSSPQVTFRQAGDSAILVEFGTMNLDIITRARIHAFQGVMESKRAPGILSLCPCIRSILCYYDPKIMAQDEFLRLLIRSEQEIGSNINDIEFVGRRITFPIVLDDKWNREALQRYMSTIRDKAVYLPSNVEYLARNNGLSNKKDALEKLIESDWIVLGVGFYFACPFLIPIDPRCRLIGQKMNPSRTYTPRGAVGIAGPVAAIYPVESPGGYQLFGRTIPTWQTWGKGKDFQPDRPWLLQAFDQITFKPVTEEEYIVLEKEFDSGRYVFEIQPSKFSVQKHLELISSLSDITAAFRDRQDQGRREEEERERVLLQTWEADRDASKRLILDSSSYYLTIADDDISENDTVTAPLFATIWKVKCRPNQVIESETEVLVILEAMKTEIPVSAGAANRGKTVIGFPSHVFEGSPVSRGDILVFLSSK